MAKKPRANKDKNPGTAPLLAALKFIEPASRDMGQPNQTHCALGGNWVVSFDGVLCMAAKIDSDIVACPNTKKLLAALSHCDETTQITQLDNNRLSVVSGKYRAFIPCLEPGSVTVTPPDVGQYPIDERVKQSLEIVGKIAKENAPRMVAASVLLQHGSAVATDGNILFEHWHGWQLPSVVVPKVFITELVKIPKKLTHMGASSHSATFWFEDASFIRTQLYTEQYPGIERITSTLNRQQPVPEGLWSALEKIEALKNDDKCIYFTEQGITTHLGEEGASYELPGLPPNLAWNIDYLRMLAPHTKTIDFNAQNGTAGMAVAYGDNFRGFLMQMRVRHAEPDTVENTGYRNPHADDDIPF